MHGTEKSVALVLGGGGARGIAHIGAIEELERRGYRIGSVAGTSMGALVGGVYAAGYLAEFREWLCALDRYKVFSLVDFSLATDGLVKGDRIIESLKRIVPDLPIGRMRMPFVAVAADLASGREVLFDSGGLYDAVRASISIPSVFRPVHRDGMVLVDGGTVNPLPVNRVVRMPGDRLVAVDVSAPFGEAPVRRARMSLNYYRMLVLSSQVMQQHLARLMCELHRPDLLVELPADRYGVFEFFRAREIIEAGRAAMRAALNREQDWAQEPAQEQKREPVREAVCPVG